MNKFNQLLRIPAVLLLCLVLPLTSCDKDFGELNRNPQAISTLDSKFILNYAVNRAGSSRFETWRGNLIYASQWSQQLSGAWAPDNYNTTNEDWLSAYWNEAYGTYMRNLQTIINQEDGTNAEAMAMIFKVLIMQRVTDMYGDIPYSEAFQGGDFPQPSYDTQEEIYASFVADLRQAIGQLAPGNGEDVGNGDPLYNGDIDSWRRFGNSMLLRVGLRMSEANPTLAQEVVSEAIAGGLITEAAVLKFDASTSANGGPLNSGIGAVFNDFGVGGGGFAYSDEIITRLQGANDPRLAVLAQQYNSDGSENNAVTPEDFLGKANGADIATIFDFVMPNHDVMVAYDSPIIFHSIAETEFSRAEAILRGWAPGSAQEAYEAGVRAACEQLALYPRSTEITDAQVDALLAEDDVSWDDSNGMELINTQKWIALLFDGFEAYSNYRRTGFPAITPGLTAGESPNAVPLRMRYPVSESLTNGANYSEAIGRLSGGDVITAPVWWDR
jgi:hypothetical protein